MRTSCSPQNEEVISQATERLPHSAEPTNYNTNKISVVTHSTLSHPHHHQTLLYHLNIVITKTIDLEKCYVTLSCTFFFLFVHFFHRPLQTVLNMKE